MWRILNGIPRAIRAHFHGPRAATGACVEEEKTDFESEHCVDNKETSVKFHRKECKFGPRVNWQHADQDEKDWWRRQSCRNDFWSMFYGPHDAFEAVTWGAAVVLGIQLSRPRWRDRYLQDGSGHSHRRNSFLYQVAFALPTSKSTKLSIKPEAAINSPSEEQRQNDGLSELEKVMKDFEKTCTNYIALGKSIMGLKHMEAGNMSAAIVNLTDASSLDHSSSQFNLGLCYETGDGVKKDINKAMELYEKAGESNHAEALYNLALLQNYPEQMVQLLTKSADLGLAQAQTSLGVYYTESNDLESMEKAASYFKLAADQNESEAQCFLAMCYERGLGVEVNECKAADLYHKAAQSGHDGAIYNLAVFHEHGLGGIPQDRVFAFELYDKAAKAGNEHAKFRLDEIKANLAVDEWNDQYSGESTREINTFLSSTSLSPSTSSPSISEYVRKHLMQLTFSANYCVLESPEEDRISKSKHLEQRARFSIGEDDMDDQDYMAERRNGLLRLSSLTPNCGIMGMSRNSTMPELGYIPCP